MNILYLFLVFLTINLSNSTEYIQTYKKFIIQANYNLVEQSNKKNKDYSLKLYQRFQQYTFEQLKAKYLINQIKPLGLLRIQRPQSLGFISGFWSRQTKINWTRKGVVSPVKDQMNCGSCYAFAAISDIQSTYLFNKKALDLSQQQIIDCSGQFGNSGCEGGWYGTAFEYTIIKGLNKQQIYPSNSNSLLFGKEGQCRFNKGQYKIRKYAYTSNKIYDCIGFKNMLKKRPVTVAVAASQQFFYYQKGVFDKCGIDINHAVHAVGLFEGNQNFYIVKNSWGLWWGEYGYMRINSRKDYGNHCEICYAPSYSIL